MFTNYMCTIIFVNVFIEIMQPYFGYNKMLNLKNVDQNVYPFKYIGATITKDG